MRGIRARLTIEQPKRKYDGNIVVGGEREFSPTPLSPLSKESSDISYERKGVIFFNILTPASGCFKPVIKMDCNFPSQSLVAVFLNRLSWSTSKSIMEFLEGANLPLSHLTREIKP